MFSSSWEMSRGAIPLRFRREIEALHRLDHPNIVKIKEFGLEEDKPRYYVMEYSDEMVSLDKGDGKRHQLACRFL
jgi:serine/threonine protein kinase